MNFIFILSLQILFTTSFAFSIFSEKPRDNYNPLYVRDTTNFEKSYDFVVIGSGSAGAVIASRLSELRKWDVLLLEVGENENTVTDTPLISATGTSYDWNYAAEPVPGFCKFGNGVCNMARGKALGGSSVLNAMVYTRGNPQDYDNWAALGNTGWDYKSVLEYFLKSENNGIPELKNSSYHREGGLLDIQHAPFQSVVTGAFLGAGVELGYNITDVNSRNQLGFQRTPATLRRGRRCSTSKAFLLPFQNRPNLHVSKNSLVTKILIDGTVNVAFGVEFKKNGVRHIVYVNKEVILSAGAIASPQLLMLSGVGPKAHLESLNIPVIRDLKVGQNYKDHVYFAPIPYTVTKDLPYVQNDELALQDLIDYTNNNKGPYTVPAGLEGVAFLQTTNKNDKVPDIEITIVGRGPRKDQFMQIISLLHPKTTGQILLRNRDAASHPIIDTNLLQNVEDVNMLREGIRLALKVGETNSFKAINATLDTSRFEPLCPGENVNSDSFWNCAISYFAGHGYHSVGTCRMGPLTDLNAVVNDELLVYGIDNLRVADLSIAPTTTSGHTQAAATMIGEKAADMIKAKWNSGSMCNRCNVIWQKLVTAISDIVQSTSLFGK